MDNRYAIFGVLLLMLISIIHVWADKSETDILEKWTFNNSKSGKNFKSTGKLGSILTADSCNVVSTPGGKGLKFLRSVNSTAFCKGSKQWGGKKGPSPLSVEIWVKLTPVGLKSHSVLLAKWQGGLYFRIWNGRLIWRYTRTGYKLDPEKWYHLVYTAKKKSGGPAATASFYVNGKCIKTGNNYEFDWGPADTLLCIGTTVPKIGTLDGTIDEIRIWERELSPSEVKESFRRGPTVN